MTVGRNDPCPCGSGQKYKKCCLAKEQQTDYAPPAPAARAAGSESTTSDARVVAFLNEGEKLRLQGQYPAALSMLDQAVALDTRFAPSFFNRGMVHFSMKNYDAMRADFAKAESLAPKYAQMFRKMGVPYVHSLDFDNAVRVLQKSIALDPADPQAWLWLARAYYDLVDDKAAFETLTKAAARFPNDAVLRVAHLLYVSRVQDSWETIHAERERFTRGLEELFTLDLKFTAPEKDLHFIPSLLAYHGVNDKKLRERLAQLMLKMAPSLGTTALHCLPSGTRRPGPIRVGFVSENTDVNTTNQFITGVLGALNQDPELEVFLFSRLPSSAESYRIAAQVAHFIPVAGDLVAARQAISSCELDVVVYLEPVNYHLSYFLSFARLAPIQVMWGGFPVTSGVPNMDYFFVAHNLEPEKPEEHFSEKLEMFDRILAYFVKPKIEGVPKPKAEYGLPDGDVRNYLCPVMLHKVHPDMYDTFADILARDDKAQIVLFFMPEGKMRGQIEASINKRLSPEQQLRVKFIPFAKPNDFLHLLRLADCVLDVPHFSFGTTAFLALAADVPFVAYNNPMTCGRAALYMYYKMGIPELVANSQEEYVALALKIAQDPAYRAELSRRISEKRDMFFEDAQAGLDLAARIKQLYAQHAAKKAA